MISKNNLPYIGIIILILVILFQPKRCDYTPPTPKIDTVIVYQTIRDTIKVETIKYLGSKTDTVWIKEPGWIPDSTYKGLLDQYTLLGSHHFKRNVFSSEFKIADYGTVAVTDTIYGNWLINSWIATNLTIPTTTITIEKETPKKNQFYFGPSIGISKSSPISGVYGNILLKTKSDQIYSLSLGYNTEPTVMFGYYWKIKLKK